LEGARAAGARRREPLYGTLAGSRSPRSTGVIGRRISAIRAREQSPQWLDYAAFGLTVGLALRRQRRD
jgi:hypothetical protein